MISLHLFQVMARCRQATSHYTLANDDKDLLSPCGVTRPQWVNFFQHILIPYIDGLVQDCSISIANALEILQSCIKPSILSLCYFWTVNSLWPNDAIWRQRSGSTLAQVMACCLMAPSHYVNQCWFTISKVHWHSFEYNFTSAINH